MIGTGGARELASVCLAHLSSLQRLALESNLVGNLGLDAMTVALTANTTLKEIFLYNNDLDDDPMAEFANMLSNKHQL